MENNLVLIFSKLEWLKNPDFKWSEEEIDRADEKGFIGNRFGVDCYVSRNLLANAYQS